MAYVKMWNNHRKLSLSNLGMNFVTLLSFNLFACNFEPPKRWLFYYDFIHILHIIKILDGKHNNGHNVWIVH